MSRLVQVTADDFNVGAAGPVSVYLHIAPVRTGTLLVAFVNENDSNNADTILVSDNRNGNWTKAAGQVFEDDVADGWFEKQSIWYKRHPAAGATTVKVDWPGSGDGSYGHVAVAEYTATGDLLGVAKQWVAPAPDADELQAISSPALVVATPAVVLGAFGNDDNSPFYPGTGAWGAPVERLSLNDQQFTESASDYVPDTGFVPGTDHTTLSQDPSPPVAPPVGTTAMKLHHPSNSAVRAKLHPGLIPFEHDGNQRWRGKGQYMFRTAEGGATRTAFVTPGAGYNVPFAAHPQGWNDFNALFGGGFSSWIYGANLYPPYSIGPVFEFDGSLSSCTAWVTDLGIEVSTYASAATPWVNIHDGGLDAFARVMLMQQGESGDGVIGTFTATATTIDSNYRSGAFVAAFEALPLPPSPTVALVGAGPLGRGEHRVFLYERGGERFVGEVGFTSLTYGRRLDDKSTAQVSIGAGTKTFLGDLRGWKHELLIARDDEEVWLGPIHEPEWEPSVVTLPADDLLGWLDNRDIAEDLTMNDVDLATTFARLVHDSMAREPSPGLYAAASLSGVVGDRSYVAAQHGAVGDALRSLGQAGVDYTCILRRLYIGALSLLPSITLTDDTLLSPKVKEGKAATKVTLVGATTSNIGQPIEAVAGGPNVELGLLEKTINDPDVMTHDGADHYARDAYAFLNPAPLYVTGVLAPTAPIDMEHLIPGMHVAVKVSSTDRKVDDVCRLTQVDVTVRPSEQGQTETVVVTLVPVGLEG